MEERYDYIIVGAGSAGSVVANRLSADPGTTVLLIESGPDHNDFMVDMPRGVGVINNLGSKFNWSYPDALTGEGRPPERWFKGRGLGGSSSVNGMVYMRGSPRDYDRWEADGCEGWGWGHVGAAFKALEDHQLGEDEWRGAGGPLKISVHSEGDALCEAIIDAAGEMGVERASDINEPARTVDGSIGYQPATIWRGKRFSAARAFLDPARARTNLHIAIETTVLKILIADGRASGVELRNKRGIRTVAANREIILSAGAIETPKLLQLSGIGPAPLLRSLGIEIVRDAAQVGENLREHRHLDLQFRVRDGSQNKNLGGWRLIPSVLRYVATVRGPDPLPLSPQRCRWAGLGPREVRRSTDRAHRHPDRHLRRTMGTAAPRLHRMSR